jgi:hypothetical protein
MPRGKPTAPSEMVRRGSNETSMSASDFERTLKECWGQHPLCPVHATKLPAATGQPSRNIRMMFDYLHGDIVKQVSPTNFDDAGSRFNAFAMRTQVTF